MEYFLVLLFFNTLALGLLVLILKALSIADLKTTVMVSLASLGLGFSLPLSLLYFNYVTVILIYGLAVVIFAGRLSFSFNRITDTTGTVETKVALIQVGEPATGHVNTATGKFTSAAVAVVPGVKGDKELAPVNDEGAKGAGAVIVKPVEIVSTLNVVADNPSSETIIVTTLDLDAPDAASITMTFKEPELAVKMLTEEFDDQTLAAESLHMVNYGFVESAGLTEEKEPAETVTLMDDLALEDRSMHKELSVLDESFAALPNTQLKVSEISNDIPSGDLQPDDEQLDIFSLINAGFDARSKGDAALALGFFLRGLDYSYDPRLSLYMAKEISDIYKESGQYFLAAAILRALADSGSGLSLSERGVLLEQAEFLEQMDNN